MESAYLFGSYAHGEAKPESDVDIIVYAKPEMTTGNLFSFMEATFETLGKGVDIYEDNELLPGPFRDMALAKSQ